MIYRDILFASSVEGLLNMVFFFGVLESGRRAGFQRRKAGVCRVNGSLASTRGQTKVRPTSFTRCGICMKAKPDREKPSGAVWVYFGGGRKSGLVLWVGKINRSPG